MNYEEARKLKKGTPILIRTKAVSVDVAGDIVYETRARDQEYEVMYTKTGYQYADIQTSEQALDADFPERLFKKGDKVRSKKLRGRYYSSAAQRYADCILTVESDEITSSRDGEIWVTTEDDDTWNTDPVYLELVTPVEETPEYNARKYTVHEVRSGPGKIDFFAIRKGDITVAAFFCDNDKSLSEDEARVEAEYECDRLNN